MDGPAGGDGVGKAFDPRPYLRRIQSRTGEEAEYLDVKWRLVWLRMEHPDARITTEHVTLSDSLAVFRATVDVPGGAMATGYGSQTSRDFPDFIEAAETKAIGRALAALGYGTQFARDFDLEAQHAGGVEHIADAPVERTPAATTRESQGQEPTRIRPVPPTEPEPSAPASSPSSPAQTPTPTPARESAPSARGTRSRRDQQGAPRTPSPGARSTQERQEAAATPNLELDESAPEPSPAETPPLTPAESRPAPAPEARAAADEFDKADFKWNDFWHWARGLGYTNKAMIEGLLGIDNLLAHTPREARRLVETYRSEHGEE